MSYTHPSPKQRILNASKLKEFADDNFTFDENCRKFSEWVENAVGKGEIAHYGQLLLFSTVFPKDFYCSRVKKGLVWKGLKCYLQILLI